MVFRHFLRCFFKATLNIGILKLYKNGFTIELAKCRTFADHTKSGGKRCRQNAVKLNTAKAGSQTTSDTATTIKSVLERRSFVPLRFGTYHLFWYANDYGL